MLSDDRLCVLSEHMLLPDARLVLCAWRRTDVYDFFLLQNMFLIEFNCYSRGGIETGVFKQHCLKIPKEVREQYKIDHLAIGRIKQKRILSRIDIAVFDALFIWSLSHL